MIFYVEIEEEEPGKETSVPGDLCREFGFDPEKVAYAVGEKTLLLLNKPTNVEVNLKITGDEGILPADRFTDRCAFFSRF